MTADISVIYQMHEYLHDVFINFGRTEYIFHFPSAVPMLSKLFRVKFEIILNVDDSRNNSLKYRIFAGTANTF